MESSKKCKINPRASSIHKITEDTIHKHGKDTCTELTVVRDIMMDCKKQNIPIVAHNASFDSRLLIQTADAFQIYWPLERADFFCTQVAARPFVKALDKNGRIKAPSNIELFMFFSNTKPEGDLHDALVDCKVTSYGYCKGKQAGWW